MVDIDDFKIRAFELVDGTIIKKEDVLDRLLEIGSKVSKIIWSDGGCSPAVSFGDESCFRIGAGEAGQLVVFEI